MPSRLSRPCVLVTALTALLVLSACTTPVEQPRGPGSGPDDPWRSPCACLPGPDIRWHGDLRSLQEEVSRTWPGRQAG